MTTDAGDICLWDDCHAEVGGGSSNVATVSTVQVAELYTGCGNVHCKRLYGTAKILIKEQVGGMVTW